MCAKSLEKALLRVIDPWITFPPKIVRMSFLRGVFRIKEPDKRKTVYITFDDGPIPESTPWLLETLRKYGIKATFFMVGDNVRKYPHLYRQVLDDGHKVGNHTMHHLNGLMVWTSRYIKDVQEAATYIESDLLRPPHGWMRVLQREYLRKHYKIVMYDVVTRDYSKFVTASQILENVKKYTRPGSIIVFHDSLKSIDKLKSVLTTCLDWLCENGYETRLLPGR